MARTKQKELRMAELAKRTGVPPRTIRLYIVRGLVEGPLRRGRRAAYGPRHVRQLERIRRLQKEGLTLRDILHRTAAEGAEGPIPQPDSWWRFVLAGDVVVNVRADVSPWRQRAIQRALARMAAELAAPEKERQSDECDN